MRIGLIIRVRSFLIKGKEREMVIVGKLFGKTWLFDTLVEIAGSILIGVAIYNFALPAKFPMTGFSGLALILYRLFDLPIGVMTIVLNIPVAILCYRVLGRRFFLCSVRCMILSSLFVDYIAPMLPQYTGERLVAAICAGVLGGLGYYVLGGYASEVSSIRKEADGADFITMALKAKHPHLPLGRFIMLTDGIVVVLGGIIFRDFDGIVYGMMIDLIFAVIADKIMYGANAGKLALIVTDHGEAVTERIDELCGRGTTIIDARGGFRKDHRDVVLCACSGKEMFVITREVKLLDPASFTIILESNEVHGEGFRMLRVAEPHAGDEK